MRITSIGAIPLTLGRKFGRPRLKTVDALADDLIAARYLWTDHYLEMKHLDPKWMVALYVYACALRKAFAGPPLDRE